MRPLATAMVGSALGDDAIAALGLDLGTERSGLFSRTRGKTGAIIGPTTRQIGLLDVAAIGTKPCVFLLGRGQGMTRLGVRTLRRDLDHILARACVARRGT